MTIGQVQANVAKQVQFARALHGGAAAGRSSGAHPAAPAGGAAVPGDVLALTVPPEGPAVNVRYVAGDKVFDREAVLALWQPVSSGRPVVFLNYRETVLTSDAGREWLAIGAASGGLRPGVASFTAISAHANGNMDQALETGLRFTNTGKAPLAVRLDGVEVSKGTRAGTPATIEVPPGGSVNVPIARAEAHPRNGNPRDGVRPVVFKVEARVVSGNPADLAVHDVARFPKAGLPGPERAVPAAGLPLHHEGVFLPQRQVTAPPVLATGNAAYVKIRGSNADHDAHYYVGHKAYVAIPAGQPPRSVVFGGPGGLLRPEVGGKRLPPIGNVIDKARPEATRGGERYRNLARHLEFALPFSEAVRQGYLKRTDSPDPKGNPVYEVDVRFVAGDNGDLLIYGIW